MVKLQCNTLMGIFPAEVTEKVDSYEKTCKHFINPHNGGKYYSP